jgi:hypothetical protein
MAGAWQSAIERAAHAPGASVQDVRVDHCGADAFVAEEFLDRADGIAGFEQMRRSNWSTTV